MANEDVVPKALLTFIATRERRVSKAFGYNRCSLSQDFERLLQGQVVRVGGRASCGPKVDPSWVEFVAWREIVRKAASIGLKIEATPVKHGNGWATKAGGFWDENDYCLASARKAIEGVPA
jgi:hypothetical protein